MRPLSFENLRRLVGRKKDRNEPSFKRSESFKRISIRKSYLDRGKRRNKLQKSLEPTIAPPSAQVDANAKPTIEKQAVIKEQKSKKLQDDTLSRESISYDEWLQGVSSSSREKLDELHREQQQNKQNNRQQQQRNNQVGKFQRQNEAADHVAEELKVLELDASPVLPPKSHRIVPNETITIRNEEKNGCHQDVVLQLQETKSVEGPPPSVSVNLGRIWRDAVPMPPFPPAPSSGPSIHHSLDSALKERKPQPTVARTVSAPEKSVAGKDVSSAFGFSLRIARLADFRPGLLFHTFLIGYRRRNDEITKITRII